MAISALGPDVLSTDAIADAVADVLRKTIRHRRGQQYLLSTATGGHARVMAPCCPLALPLRNQGQPVPDAHEEAARSRRSARSSLHSYVGARQASGSGALPTPTA